MKSKEIRDGRLGKTAFLIEGAHRIRRRMRDIRGSELREISVTSAKEREAPRFLLFRGFGLSQRPEPDTSRGVQFWSVLGVWLLLAAFIGAVVCGTLYSKGYFRS